jgi:peptidoglycan/LPS O-acetylase OafA/YrhL
MSDKGYIKSLDGVRAIAIILVMSYHADLTHFGWMGVQIFFVLSGFLITGILWKERQAPGSIGFKFRKFWVRRSLRIFPLYFAYIGIIGLAYLLFHFPSYFALYFPYLVTYTVNFTRLLPGWYGNPLFSHLWSLSIEEQFYLLFPFIMLLGRPKFIKILLLSIICLSPLFRYLLGEYYRNKGLTSDLIATLVDMHTFSHLDAFCIGGIIPVLSLGTRIKRPALVFGSFALIAFAAGLINYLYSNSPYPYWQDGGFNHWLINNHQYVWMYSLINFSSASFLLFLVSPYRNNTGNWLVKFLEFPWAVRIGKISYGMYVFHWLILVYVFNHLLPMESYQMKLILFIPYVIVVYLFSSLSYTFFEAWFIRLKDRFFKNPGPAKTGFPASPAILQKESSNSI